MAKQKFDLPEQLTPKRSGKKFVATKIKGDKPESVKGVKQNFLNKTSKDAKAVKEGVQAAAQRAVVKSGKAD